MEECSSMFSLPLLHSLIQKKGPLLYYMESPGWWKDPTIWAWGRGTVGTEEELNWGHDADHVHDLGCYCLAAQSCPTLWDAMDHSLPGSSVHGISRQKYWSGLPFPSPGLALIWQTFTEVLPLQPHQLPYTLYKNWGWHRKPACQEKPRAHWLRQREHRQEEQGWLSGALESETPRPGADVQVTTHTLGWARPGWQIPAAVTGRWEGRGTKPWQGVHLDSHHLPRQPAGSAARPQPLSEWGSLVSQNGLFSLASSSFVKDIFIYLIFGCAGSLWAFFSCSSQASHCSGFSCWRARAAVVVAHGLSCSSAYGIFPDQGWNPGPLH